MVGDAAAEGRHRRQPAEPQAVAVEVDRHGIVGEVGPEQRGKARRQAVRRIRREQPPPAVAQVERDRRRRHRQPPDDVDARREFGALRFQELAPRRNLREQAVDRHPRPRRQRGGAVRHHPAMVDHQRPAVAGRRPAGQRQRRDAGDRRQRLAAKAERGDRRQVAVGQLRRRVALDRQPQLVGVHAAAVVDHRQMIDPAGVELDRDPRRAGVDRIFDEFLERRRRALDDFAGGDLVDEVVGQAADRHWTGPYAAPRPMSPARHQRRSVKNSDTFIVRRGRVPPARSAVIELSDSVLIIYVILTRWHGSCFSEVGFCYRGPVRCCVPP